jgi:hypothetical protein
MYALRLLSIATNRLAAALPSAAIASIRDLRTATSANSLATKNPFASTRIKTKSSFRLVARTLGNSAVTSVSAARNKNKLAGSSIADKRLKLSGTLSNAAHPFKIIQTGTIRSISRV